MKLPLMIALSLILAPQAMAVDEPLPTSVTIPISMDRDIGMQDLDRAAWVCTASLPGLVGGPSVLEQLAMQMDASHLHLNPDYPPLPISYKPGAVGFTGGMAEWATPAGNSSVKQFLAFELYSGSNLDKREARLEFNIGVDINNWVGYGTDYTFGFPTFTYDRHSDFPHLSGLGIHYVMPSGTTLDHISIYDRYTGKITPFAINGQVYVDCLIQQLKLPAHTSE